MSDESDLDLEFQTMVNGGQKPVTDKDSSASAFAGTLTAFVVAGCVMVVCIALTYKLLLWVF